MTSELLTPVELADRLRISARTVKVWTREGRIPVIRVGAKVLRYELQAVLAVLRKSGARGHQ